MQKMKFSSFQIYALIFFMGLSCSSLFAQEEGQEDQARIILPLVKSKKLRHAVHMELLGRGFLFASVNYEYKLTNRFSLGGGLGLAYVGRGEITRLNNGVTETGRYFETSSTQLIYGNYFLGKGKHKLLITAGLTHFLSTDKNKYPSGTVRSNQSQIEWNAGMGYQYSHKRMFGRLTGYCISLPDPAGWFPKYIPWGGISIGYRW